MSSPSRQLLRPRPPLLSKATKLFHPSVVNSNPVSTLKNSEISAESVSQFIHDNPSFLESFIINEVSPDTVERWYILKKEHQCCEQIRNDGSIKEACMSNALPSIFDLFGLLSKEVADAIEADNFTLYVRDPSQEDILLHYTSSVACDLPARVMIMEGLTVQGHVATVREPILHNTVTKDDRFPADLGEATSMAQSVLCLPLLRKGQLFGVVVLSRTPHSAPFNEEEAKTCIQWFDVYISNLCPAVNPVDKAAERGSCNFLSAILSIFKQLLSTSSDPHILLKDIVVTLYQQIGAKAGSLFLVDFIKRELYAKVFEPSLDNKTQISANKLVLMKDTMAPPKEIRLPLGTGTVGQCYQQNKIVNVTNYQQDPTSCNTVNTLMGRTAQTTLDIPITIKDKVIGVLEIVNKTDSTFDKRDEVMGEMVAVICGAVINYVQQEETNKVLKRLLSHHRQCTRYEVQLLKEISLQDISGYPIGEFDFDCTSVPDQIKPQIFITMLKNLSSTYSFNDDQLMHFILSVRRGYHDIPYHNWNHALFVAHTIYAIIKHSNEMFTELEAVSLLVAGICHDLEHPGKNNTFMVQSGDPIAILYSSSPLEKHHYNQACLILQDKQNNIFSNLESVKPEIYEIMEEAILATDIAVYCKNSGQLKQLMTDGAYDFNQSYHRMLVRAVLMSSSDLSANALPWDNHYNKVLSLFEEFYKQGDKEKESGRVPLSLMDREKSQEVPIIEVFFLSNICIPCCDALAKAIPGSLPLLKGTQDNIHQWQKISNKNNN